MSEIKLLPCPFCGGEAKLEIMYESCDGRGDRYPHVKCTVCQAKIDLSSKEFFETTDRYGYKGGYYTQNKKLWEGIHQKVVDKWNTRNPVADVLERLEELFDRSWLDKGKKNMMREIIKEELGIEYDKD